MHAVNISNCRIVSISFLFILPLIFTFYITNKLLFNNTGNSIFGINPSISMIIIGAGTAVVAFLLIVHFKESCYISFVNLFSAFMITDAVVGYMAPLMAGWPITPGMISALVLIIPSSLYGMYIIRKYELMSLRSRIISFLGGLLLACAVV